MYFKSIRAGTVWIMLGICYNVLGSDEFEEFRLKFSKSYSSHDEMYRRSMVFYGALEKIKTHNANPKKTYTRCINKFADITEEEFSILYTGRLKTKRGSSNTNSNRYTNALQSIHELPKEVDWRTSGCISKVLDQGDCGSCWAFAAIQAVESYVCLGTKKLHNLSPQQVVSCMPNPSNCGGNGGCQGANVENGFSYIQQSGLSLEADYPYISGHNGTDEKCDLKYSENKTMATVRGYEALPSNDIKSVMNHLAHIGPLAVSVYVDEGFTHYSGGVYDGCSIDKNIDINHSVLLVGYGTDIESRDYWLVKNSYGNDWGEDGYIRIKREKEPKCGIDNIPLNGTACEEDGYVEDGHDSLKAKVCGTCGILSDVSYPIGATII